MNTIGIPSVIEFYRNVKMANEMSKQNKYLGEENIKSKKRNKINAIDRTIKPFYLARIYLFYFLFLKSIQMIEY